MMIGDLPRKPLTREQAAGNTLKGLRVDLANDQLDVARKRIAERHHLDLELDYEDGAFFFIPLEGALDFPRFTPENWTTFTLLRGTIEHLLDQTRFPEMPTTGKPLTVTRWKKLP